MTTEEVMQHVERALALMPADEEWSAFTFSGPDRVIVLITSGEVDSDEGDETPA